MFKLTRPGFPPGVAYTAADFGPFVGTVDLSTGIITPIVTGLSNPGGLIFVDTSNHDDTRDRGSDDSDCRDRDRECH